MRLFVASLLLLHALAVSALSRNDLGGPYLLRVNGSTCPRFVDFKPGDPSRDVALMAVDGRACSAGEFRFADRARVDTIAAFLRPEPSVRDWILLVPRAVLVCDRFSFDRRATFTFAAPLMDLSVDLDSALGRVNSSLAVALGDDTYTFEANVSHLLINDQCLYTRMTQEEFDRQKGEKCFPASATVTTQHGAPRRIQHLATAQLVADGRAFTHTIGWTHRDPHFEGWFLRISLRNVSATMSHGHYVYSKRGLITADELAVGTMLRTAYGWQPVTAVERVWRRGLYNVQTASGRLLVDHILCSTYTKAVPPVLAHALLAPVRMCAPFGLHLLSAFF
ncbi:hypothetical protein BWQ96_04106 [Gracilariopsis chorda]|uniref:Hedgehog protein Hint domain-containing protein n=1 Tax=Gracilariopsis chorda TaxID=448386 RepID=A0A2V3IY90_9FLOR|nr:hypothetical protein BWQ96_04106 [Gracilariopsis chorda]|eukprot:PXF46100.1 hypothetical protein BWQ96_04106 [Gracilariopsis chorda]